MAPAPRIILLGGSNLTRGISTIVEIARGVVGGPASFLIAMGYGRSYGQRSRVLGRSLPGIAECGLWDALDAEPAGPTYALITDIGNDVVYGAATGTITGWVEACLDRLARHSTRTVMTLLPMVSLDRMPPWQYRLALSVFFPGSDLPLADALAGTRALNEGVRTLAGERGVGLVDHDDRWYGLDPIHIKRRFVAKAWSCILAGWSEDRPSEARIRPSIRRWLRLRTMTPQEWWVLGRRLGRDQPAGRLADGSAISLF